MIKSVNIFSSFLQNEFNRAKAASNIEKMLFFFQKVFCWFCWSFNPFFVMLFRKCRRKNIGKNYKKRFQLDLDFLLSIFKKQLRNKKCKKVKKDFVCASLMFKNNLKKKCFYNFFLNNFIPYFRFELLSYFI